MHLSICSNIVLFYLAWKIHKDFQLLVLQSHSSATSNSVANAILAIGEGKIRKRSKIVKDGCQKKMQGREEWEIKVSFLFLASVLDISG